MARKHPTRVVIASVVVATFAMACTDDPSANNTPVTQEHVSSSSCANAELASRGGGRTGAEISGDFDNDGVEDSVYITNDESADLGCKSFVVIDTGDVVYTAAADPSGEPRSLQVPSLNSLVDVTGDGGPEAVVNVEMGASTQFVSLFTLTEQGLEQMLTDARGPGPFAQADEGLFAFGGSVGHIEGVNCTDDGMIEMVAALPKGNDPQVYLVHRRFFRVNGTELVLDGSLSAIDRVAAGEVGNLPALVGSPFGSCD